MERWLIALRDIRQEIILAKGLIQKLVESAGIEPASANTLQQVLHT